VYDQAPKGRGAAVARWLRRLARTLCTVPVLLPRPAAAAAPSFTPTHRPTAAEATDRDWLLSVRARAALRQDAQLGPLNLGVSVRGAIVTVWGSVPSLAAARRAEALLGRVPGVGGVHSELRVVAPDDPQQKILAPAPAPPRTAPPVLSEPPPLKPGALTGRVAEPEPSPLVVTPVIKVPSQPRAPEPTPPAAAQPQADLATVIERLHQQDARFRAIQVEVRGGVVRLRGSPRQAADVIGLATAVSQVPGVERVLVDGINTSP
jgi:osmotically-inducible protein OsmY